MWEADEQCEPEMVSGSAGRNSIVHVALWETINDASPSTVNALRSMQTPLTRGLFCLLRSSSTTLGANISSAWIMARGYFGIFRAGRASGCMCYSPSLLSTLLTKMPNSGKILHSCAHLETHTRIHLVWDARVHNPSEFLCFPWYGIWTCHFPCWKPFGFAKQNDNNKWILLSLGLQRFLLDQNIRDCLSVTNF